MVDISNISKSGPIKFPDHDSDLKNNMLDPASWKAPEHMGEKTAGLKINGPSAVAQALDKKGNTEKTSPELETEMSKMAIFGLGEVIAKHLGR